MKSSLLLILPGLLIFSCAQDGSSDATDNSSEASIPELLVTLSDSTFEAPDSVQAGYVHLKYNNLSSGMHSAHLIKRAPGYSTDELIQAYTDSMISGGPRPDWMVHRGGVISETGQSEITMLLEPGEYTWVCVMGDDAPHFAGHEHQSFKVYGEIPENTELPASDLSIVMNDHNFEFENRIEAGNYSIDILNSGTKYHLVAIAKLNDGATPEDVINWYTSFQGPPPAEGVFATSAIGPNLTARINVEFESGSYILYCMANAEGRFHLLDGAVTEFQVR